MAKKAEWYLAVRDDDRDIPSRVWDMLRYDSCYPVSNAPSGWVVLKQPYRDGIKGGFTLARWSSFGFRDLPMAPAPLGHPGIPSDLHAQIRAAEARKEYLANLPKKVTVALP